MRYSRWFALVLCYMVVCFTEGCASSEDLEPSSIEAMPYVVNSEAISRDSNNTLARLNRGIQARWSIEKLQITSDGWLHLDMTLFYSSPFPPNFHFRGDALLISLQANYRAEVGLAHGHTVGRNIQYAPIFLRSKESGMAELTYNAPFEVPPSEDGGYRLIGLGISFSWVRMYHDGSKGNFFEWVTSRDMAEPEMSVGQVYHDIDGWFDVYQPIHERETTILYVQPNLDADGDGLFDYATWLVSQILDR